MTTTQFINDEHGGYRKLLDDLQSMSSSAYSPGESPRNAIQLRRDSVARVSALGMELSNGDSTQLHLAWYSFLSAMQYSNKSKYLSVTLDALVKVRDSNAMRRVFTELLKEVSLRDHMLEAIQGRDDCATLRDLTQRLPHESGAKAPVKPVSRIWSATDFVLRQGGAAIDTLRPLLHSMLKSVLTVPGEFNVALGLAEQHFSKAASNVESQFLELSKAAYWAIRHVRGERINRDDITNVFVCNAIHNAVREELANVDPQLAFERGNVKLQTRVRILQKVVESSTFSMAEMDSLQAHAGEDASAFVSELQRILDQLNLIRTKVVRGINAACA